MNRKPMGQQERQQAITDTLTEYDRWISLTDDQLADEVVKAFPSILKESCVRHRSIRFLLADSLHRHFS